MDFRRRDAQAAPVKSRMVLPFPDEDDVPVHVGGNHEQRVFVAAYGKPLALAVGEELGASVFSGMLPDNGGTSTAVANRGIPEGVTMRGEGKKLGTMTGLSIQTNGEIYGSYSNGNTVLLGQIAVAQFANASGLLEMGDNCYDTTLNSGEFDGIGIDISADGSSMNTGQLEMANVDLSSEFTDMITTQRGFQANSRIITVSDTMLEELINLKR